MRRAIPLMVLPLLAVAPLAAARGPQLVAPAPLKLEQRTSAPTFTPATLRLMDRGRLVYVGKGMWAEQATFYLRELPSARPLRVVAPFAAYVASNPELLPEGARPGPLHKKLHITELLYYDREHGEAAFEVADHYRSQGVRRHFLVQWDLKRNVISHVTLVARSKPGVTYTHSLPLGYDPAQRAFFYARQVISQKADARDVFVIGFSGGKPPRVVAQFVAERSMRSNAYFDAPSGRAMLVEYAERASTGPAPKGHLIDTRSGKALHFPIPLTCYGFAFGPAGKRLYAYSSQLGELWELDHQGAKLRSLKVGQLGHDLGFYRGSLVLVRNSGVQLFNARAKGLAKGRYLPLSALYRGFSHVEGSRVTPPLILLRNGSELYFVSIEPWQTRPASRRKRR